MGLLDKIKQDVAKAGSSRGKFFYCKDGEKKRVRFLQDFDDGFEIPFHDSFELSINVPCQEVFGRKCNYCGEDSLRTRSQYAWAVWDYDASEVKIFMYAVNQCTPIASLAAMYENYGSILGRDFVIQRTGKGQGTSYSIIPMDKSDMENSKAKPYSKKKFLEILDEAYPDNHKDYTSKDSDDDEEEEEKPAKKEKKAAKDDELPELPFKTPGEDDEDEKADDPYEGKSAKELYSLCEDRGIEAAPKKAAAYYINLLKEADKASEDWEDVDDEEDDWDE